MSGNLSEGDSIKIFLRVRPPDDGSCERDFGPKVVDVNTADKAIILQTKPEPKVFTYDDVGGADITQEAVFSIVGKRVIESCTEGYNGTIFAYGQTGSGKTFTMLGPSENADSFHHELRGVIPRSFEYLYSIIAKQQEETNKQKQFLCRCSFLEIYQEQIFDLLDPTSQGLNLRENLNKGVFVDGLIEHVVCSPSDAYKVLITGWLNRRVAATSMNRESSRSHAVFTVNIESKEETHGVQAIRTSCLNLVDLAGSERQKDTNTVGARLKEAGSINRSLHVLGNVIMSLVDLSHGKKRHVPYRDSKLTFLLKDSLGGNAKTHMVACVHPDSKCFGETLSTLNFARNAKLIKNKAVVNEDFHGSHIEMQKEICRLKALLDSAQISQPVCHKAPLDDDSTEADVHADSVWKKHFIEAMYFRETSENEKKGLKDEIKTLQQLCEKKDKYNQSTKMIIKFRENTIQNLQKQKQSRPENTESEELKMLKEEIKILRQQLECNPLVAKYAGENKNLRHELEQMKALGSISSILNDANRIDKLERIFKELKLLKETGPSSQLNSLRDSPSKNKLLIEATEKHKSEVKGYQKEIDTLKQHFLEKEKQAESELMDKDVELVSCRKMISDLEQALEAHQLKARRESIALKDLHCQTLKVISSPVLSSRKESVSSMNRSNTIKEEDEEEEEEEGITDGGIPQDLVGGTNTNDALLEELQALTAENDKLQQTLDEHGSEMLKVKQELDKKDLLISQLKSLVEKERSELSTLSSEHSAATLSLKEQLEISKGDLSLLKDENTDLHLVLKSADKQLKEEKENHKKFQQNSKLEKQTLETQLAHKTLQLDNIAKEYEETLKELDSIKGDLEISLTTKSFYENHAQELEQALHQEVKNKEKLEARIETMKSAEDVATLQKSFEHYREDAKAQLDFKDAELNTLKADLLRKDGIIAENKDIVSNLMASMQEMKTKFSESETSCSALKMKCVNSSQELEDVRNELDSKTGEVSLLRAELSECNNRFQLELQKKDFEMINLQEDQESNSDSILALEKALDARQNQIEAKNVRIQELQSVVDDLKTKVKLQEMEIRDVTRQNDLQESFDSFKSTTAEKMKSLENLLNKREEELKAALWESERASACLQQVEGQNKDLRERLAPLEGKENGTQEEIDSLKSELAVVNETKDKLLNELKKERDGTAKLIGHNNTQQRIRLLDKKNQEYNELNQRYQDLLREHSKCVWKMKTDPHDSSHHHKLEDITNMKEK